LWNAIEYAGEDWVRESFESIKGQGDEIIVGDYSSDDGTPELAKEYGFKVFNVEKTEGIMFHNTKIINKVISKSKSNFLFDLDIHTTYPKNIDEIVRSWIKCNDITKKQLIITGLFNGKINHNICDSMLLYKPFLLKARGFDERTSYRHGDSHYIIKLLKDVANLEFEIVFVEGMIHKDHREACERRSPKEAVGKSIHFGRSLYKGVKQVKNSYW
jgi:glycosyltransferase involved in cell wall biosynthesis